MAIRLTPLNNFTFTPEAGNPTYLNRGLQGDDIAYDPLTKTVFVAYTDDPDGQTGTAFSPRRAVLQFGSNNPTSPEAFGTYINGFDAAPALLANAVGITPITSGAGSGNFLVVSATTAGANTTEIVEYKPDGTIATDGLLGATSRLTLPPQYYTNTGTTASNGQPGAGRPVALAITGLGTLLVAMSQSQDLVEFSLTAKNADGTAQVISTFDLTPFGLTRLAGLAIDPISGNFIVTDDFGGGTGLIYEFTPHRKELLTARITATVDGTPTTFPYPQEVNFPRLGNLVTIINPKQEFNLQDPEGVSFDPLTRNLYVVFDGDDDVITDGSNNKVAAFSVATLDPNPPNPSDLNATPVPVLTDFSKFGQENGTIAFASNDFTSRFTDSKTAALTLEAIDIVTLPKHGTLKLGGVNVTRGQVIDADQLSSLVYTPTAGYSGTDTFLVQAAQTLDSAGKPAITAPAITNVDLFVSDSTAIQVSEATTTYRFFSADDIVFNPSTGTIFAAESYRFNNTTALSTVWILKEVNAETGVEIRTILQSPATTTPNTSGQTYTAVPGVPIVDLLPGDVREGIQGIGVVAGTGTDRDGNILLLSTRGRRIVEIDPDAPVDANGALQVPTGGIDFTVTNFFNPNNPGIVNDGLHLPSGAFTVSPGGLGSAVGVFHAVVGGQEFLYVADYSTRELVQYSKAGAKTGVVVDLQQITNGRLQGVTYDPVTGNFLLVDEETIAIYEVTPTGQLVGITDILSKATGDAALVNKFKDVEGATLDPLTRTLYLGFDDDQPGPAGAFGDDTIGNLIAAFNLTGGVPNSANPAAVLGTNLLGTNLRQQIVAANTGTAAEVTINLSAGNYILSGVGDDDNGNNTALFGDLDIASGKTIKIIGAGADQTIIDGTALNDRIFHVLDTARLELTGVTLTKGGKQNTDINTISKNPFIGGGILVAGQNASLSVTDSTITDNLADNGAGIFIYSGEATVTNTIVSENESSFDAGGISALFGGRLTLTDSTVINNTAARDAGGIGIAFGGSATITDSDIIGNAALGTFTASGPGTYGIGGGIHHNDGTTTITNSFIAGNTASEFGGGVAAYTASTNNPLNNALVTPGTLTITDARISGNTADSNADGVGDGGGVYRLDTVAGGLTPVTVTIGNTALRAGSVVGNFDTPNGAGPGNIYDSIAGTIVSSGFNIVTNPAGSTGLRGFDQSPFDVVGFGNGIRLSPPTSFAFSGGDGIDFHDGKLYALQTNITNPNPFTFNSDVVTLNPDGTEVSRFNLSNTIDASGIDVRRDNGNLLIVSGVGGWLREYTPAGVRFTGEDAIDFNLPKLADGSLIVGLEFNPVTQTVYVADVGSQFDKAIIRQYDRLGNELSTLDLKAIDGIPDTIVPQGLTIDFNRGNFLVADEVNDSIYEITRFGSLLNTFNLVTLGGGDAKFGDPEGLAVDEATDTLYVIFDNDNPAQLGNLVASYDINPVPSQRLAQTGSFSFADPAGVSASVTPERGLQGDGITFKATTGTRKLFVARTDDPDGPTGPQPRVQSVLEFSTDGTYISEFSFTTAQVPAGITTLPNGNLLIASPNPVAGGAFDGKIIEVTTTGEVVSGGINFDLPDAFNDPNQRGLVVGVAYSPAYTTNNRFRSKDASILVITSRSQEIVEFDLSGNIIASLDLSKYGVTAPQGLAINPANGNIFVTDEAVTSGGTNKIYEISPLRDELAVSARNTQLPRFGSLVSVIDTQSAFGLNDPEDVTFGSDGTLYAVFDGDDPAGSTLTPDNSFTFDFADGEGIAFRASDNRIFVLQSSTVTNPAIWNVFQYDTNGSQIGTKFTVDLGNFGPQDLTVRSDTGNLILSGLMIDTFQQRFVEINPTTQALAAGGIDFSLQATGTSNVFSGVYYNATTGTLFGTDYLDQSIKELDPTTGTVKVTNGIEHRWSVGSLLSSQSLFPQGITYDADTNHYFIAGDVDTSNLVYEVGLGFAANGTPTATLYGVTDTELTLGIQDAEGLAIDPNTRTLYASFDSDRFDRNTFGAVQIPGIGNKVARATLGNPLASNQVVAFTVQTPTGLPTLRTLDKFTVAGVASNFALTEFTTQAAQDFAPTVPVFTSTAGSLASITLMSLPGFGSLTLNGAAVTLGQTIAAADIGNLSYQANATFSGVDTFQVSAFDGTASSSPAHVDLFVSSPTARKLTATDTFNIDLGNFANDDRFDNSADGLVFNPTNGKVYTASSFRINPTDANTIGWRLIESDVDGGNPRVILQSEADALAVTGQTPFTPLVGVPVLDLVPNDTTDGVQDLGVVLGTGTARDGNILILSTRGASIFEVTPDGAPVAGGINISAPGLFESGAAFDRSAVGLLHTVENGQEYIYVTDFGERLIRKVPALKGTIANPAILTEAQVISEIRLQTALPEARLQGITIDPLTGNFFVADDASGNAAIYEIKADGTIVGSTDMLALGRELGLAQGLSGADLTAFTNKFADLEGITIDPTTRTLYAGIDDDGVGQFGLGAIGRQVVAISLDQAPVFAEESYEFTIEDDAEDGDNVGEPITATDPDTGETIVYSITGGNLDPDQDGKAAFIIDTSAGQLKINDADDLELVDVFNLTVVATDPKGLTDTTQVEVSIGLEESTTTTGIFVVNGLTIQNLVAIVNNNTNLSLGLFFTDDAQGRIGELTPDDNGYEDAVRSRSISLLNALSDSSNFAPGQLKNSLGLLNAAALVNLTDSTDLYFGFIGVTGGTIGSFTEDLTGISVSLSTNTGISIEEDDESGYQITFAGTNFSVSLSGDDDNDNTYDSDGLGISGLDTDSEVDEVVNSVISELTGETGTFTVTATVFREAAYDNTLGFFAVNSNGDVLNSSGSVATSGSFANNDTYRRAIRDNLLSGGNNIQVANGVASRFDFNVTLNDSSNAGFFILPVLAVQGSFTTAQQIYYPILGINSDTFERMAKQGVDSNGLRVYGFEDLPNGGDRDFDDFIVKIQVTSATVV